MWRWSGSAAVALLLMMNCGQTVGSLSGRETGGTGGRDARTGGRSGAGAGGEEPCPDGTETCPCYGNDTCNDDLVCASGLCVDLGTVATGGRLPITNAVIVTNTAPTNVIITNVATTNITTANVATTNTVSTNAATSNLPTTNVVTNVVTNVATNRVANVATNVIVTGVATNVATNAVTNVATNTTAPAANYIDDGTIYGYCFGFYQVGGVDTACDVESNGLSCPYSLPGTSWDDVAMIGCNLNQSPEGGTGSEGTFVPSGVEAFCIEGTGFERIQIGGPNWATDANDRWCAAVPAGGGCVALTAFNTTCWNNEGAYYANQPLQQVAALQPSKSDGVDVSVTPISDTIVVTDIHVQ